MPDNTTARKKEEEYSCEIVVRPPTIWNIGCSICSAYSTITEKARLHDFLTEVPMINNWAEINEVLPHYGEIQQCVLDICSDLYDKQTPLIIQPVWKTDGKQMRLKDGCLDVFVWSNLAVIQMCIKDEPVTSIDRFSRTIIWIYRMLLEYITHNQFDYRRIVWNLAFDIPTEIAFELSSTQLLPFLRCKELYNPRIHKNDICKIILNGGQTLLEKPNLGNIIAGSPELFDN